MPVPIPGLPPGGIPSITGGDARTGDIRNTVSLAPVNVGGLFSTSGGGGVANATPLLVIGGILVTAFLLFRNR